MNKRLNPLRPLIIPLVAIGAFILLMSVLKDIRPYDASISQGISHLPSWLTPIMGFVTVAGSPPLDVAVACVWAVSEYLSRRPHRAIIMLCSLIALPLFDVLKLIIHRARPVTLYVQTHGLHDYSFPSGHTTASAAVYGMIAVLAAAAIPKPWNRVVTVCALAFAFVVGLSRVYLGAHFPSDVVGGWLLALLIVSSLRSISVALTDRHARKPLVDTTEELGSN